MMKRIGFFLAGAFALLAIAACNDKEEAFDSEETTDEVETYDAPTIAVETAEWNAPAVGVLTTEIAVEASADWTAESADEWLSVTWTATTIRLTATENTITETRTGKVTLTCTNDVGTTYDYVTVNQDALAYISLSRETVSFSSDEGSSSVTVESNFEWDHSYDTANGWFTVERDGGVLTVTVAANETDAERQGSVTLTAGDGAENVAEAQLTITQTLFSTNDMVLTYTISSANTVVQLPLYEDENTKVTVNCTVNWGDGGDVETVTGNNPSHTYSTAGTYDVVISGTVPCLCSYYISTVASPVTTLTAVKQWGRTGLTDMECAFFAYTGLASLPEDPGDSFADVAFFYRTFSNCSALAEIPANLFGSCPVATDFEYAFRGCDLIKEIPAGLFDGCPAAEDFSAVFDACPALETIPAGLFDNCTNAKVLATIFLECPSLKAIPDGLFDKLVNATNFRSAFCNCSSLTEIPDGLFDNCPEVETFSRTFSGCTSLTKIPANLFRSCTKVTDFSYCFNSGDSSVHNLTGESAYDVQTINGVETKIHLYERGDYPDIYETPTTTSYCYRYQTGLDDYESVSSEWK